MTDYLNIRGNDSVVIWKKYLQSIGSSPYLFCRELIEKLIEKNRAQFIYQVEKSQIEIPENSRLEILYNKLKKDFTEKELREIPDFESLTSEDLEKINETLKTKD
jgi:ferric iron reductase protein FhuF